MLKKVAYEPLFLDASARPALDQGRAARGDARAAFQSAQGDLRAIRARHAAHRGLARAARRLDAARRLRQDLHRGERGHRSRPTPTRCSGRSPIAPIPIEDVHIAPYRSAGHGPKSGPRSEDSTHPDRRDAEARGAAARAAGARIHGARAQRSGRSSVCPPLTPQPPWHGYSLGDWADDWDDLSRERAVDGEWEQSGAETFARRRGGIMPETPVREVEGKK